MIDDDVVALLGECPTDAGGLYRFQVARGESGRERVLITFYPQNNGTPRHILIQAFAVTPLMKALHAFKQRDPAVTGIAPVPAPPKPKPEPKPATAKSTAMANALRNAMPWVKP